MSTKVLDTALASPRGSAALQTVPLFVWGGGGMLAGEFLRLCDDHPGLELRGAVVRGGTPLSESQPHLAREIATLSPAQADEALVEALRGGGRVALVLALPHGEAPAQWRRLRDALGSAAERVVVVDLAADYRLRDRALYASAYGDVHADFDQTASFAYGLPEFHRAAIRAATRCAAPGCFATAIQLACLPAAFAGLLDTSRTWILHGITGSSGSGNVPKPGTHHPHRHGNLWAYSLGGHRHEAELAQALSARGIAARAHLVAHSGPFARGIHLTAALPLKRGASIAEVEAVYDQAYAGEAFVERVGGGAADLRSVVGSNRAALGLSVRDDVLTVTATIDNLIKGGAGQALQCLNLMLGMPERWGLARSGMGVC